MKNKKIGFAITGSFCTFKKILLPIKKLVEKENNVVPIFSYAVSSMDTRFYVAKDFENEIIKITGNKPIKTIVEAEPIGPQKLLDLVIIAPCTGNTLGKLAHAIIDTPVLMAAKAHLRNNRPLLIGVSTNDGLSNSARNIGDLIAKKNIYFVPYRQDNCIKKENSLVADFDLVVESAEYALQGKQLQPTIKVI